MEEPENGLTPRSTKAIYEALVHVTSPQATPRIQVLVLSHSPFVLTEAWNGEQRDFIYQVRIVNGQSHVRPFADALDGKGMLRKADGTRQELGLRLADDVMDGYRS